MAAAVEVAQDLERILTRAVSKTAEELCRDGIQAEAHGTTLRARVGATTWTVHNAVTPAPPGNREEMLDTYARMVVGALTRGAAGK